VIHGSLRYHAAFGCTIWCGRVSLSGDFGLKAELGKHHGIRLGVFYSVSRNGTLIRPASTGSLWTAVAHLFRGIDLCRSESMEAGSMEEAGSGHEIPVTY
jgi:hypothetical protein